MTEKSLTPVSPVLLLSLPSIQLVATTSTGRKASNDGVPRLGGSQLPPNIHRTLARNDGSGDRSIDGSCLIAHPKRLEHQRGRGNRADRVRDVLAGEFWGRAVHGFEHRRATRMNVARGGHA